MEFSVALGAPFSLEHTLQSGQVFRWEKRGEWWNGVVSGAALKVNQDGDVLHCVTSSGTINSVFITKYFRLEDDLDHILAHLSKDKVLARSIEQFYGLRLISQDPWECLASFVLATNANIPRIKKMINSICEKYGTPFEFEGEGFHAFPEPIALADAPVEALRECGLGYRASFLNRVASSMAEGKIDIGLLSSLRYEDSRRELLKELFGEKVLLGVGPKVADCVLLYSCGQDEAFPIDVWIAKVLSRSFPRLFVSGPGRRIIPKTARKISPGAYAKISASAREHFGHQAGYAQLYLYMAARVGGL